MPTVVTLKLDRVAARIRATLSIAAEQKSVETEVSGWLPQPQAVLAAYDRWQATYRQLTRSSSRIIAREAWDRAEANPTARLQAACRQQAEALRTALNSWLQDEAFAPLLSAWYDGLPEASMEARVVIRTEASELRRLPWHLWDVLAQYPNSEVALGALDFKLPPLAARQRGRIRILAILGYAADIDIGVDWEHLKASFPTADIHELQRPSRQQLEDARLWEQEWDLLFFAGHSQTEGGTGRIFFNPDSTLAASEQSLTLKELQPYLKLAIAKGLQIAIFNSCDGLGLAEELEQLHIPQTIVMREPVPDTVAQRFLEQFLQAYAKAGSLYVAMRQAREQLHDLENAYPGASWLPVIIQNPAVPPPSWLALSNEIPPCPYKGLFAFEAADEAVFFGRERESEELHKRLQTEYFVAVVGPSGSGKSSLVKAGLLPRLQRDSGWQIVPFRPGENPLETLATALAAFVEGDEDDIQLAAARLAIALTQTDTALTQFLNALPQQRLLLVADQFEEIYTLTTDATVRTAFLENLLIALQDSPKLRLVLTVRADFLGAFYADAKFHRLLDRAKFDLYPMEPDALQRAILEPARLRGVHFEAGLVELLLADAGDREEDLPLLEFSLTQLWDRMVRGILTHQAYREIGGLRGALAQHAEAVYGRLSPEQHGLARQLFGQLVRPGEGTADTRNLATRAELGEAAWQLATQLNAEANRLVLIGTNEAGEETVEIVHEALIQEWNRLRQWLQADREFRLWQERLRSRQRQWQENNREPAYLLRGTELAIATDWLQQRDAELVGDRTFILASQAAAAGERRRGRRQRQLVSAVSIAVATVMSGLAFVAIRQTQQARQREQQALVSAGRDRALRLFEENRELEALTEAIAMGRRAQDLAASGNLAPSTHVRTVAAFHQIFRDTREYNRLEGHTDSIQAVSFSPDGKTVATAAADRTVKFWSLDGRLQQMLAAGAELDAAGRQHGTEGVGRAEFGPKGRTLVTVGNAGAIELWRSDGRLLGSLGAANPFMQRLGWRPEATYSADGQTLALTRPGRATELINPGGRVELWSADGRQLGDIESHNLVVSQMHLSPNGQILVTHGSDRAGGTTSVRFWNRAGQQLHAIEGGSIAIASPDGRILAIASKASIMLWDLAGPRPQPLPGAIRGASPRFSPDGRLLATQVGDAVQLWNLEGQQLRALRSSDRQITAFAFGPDGQTIAVADKNGEILLWSRDGQPLDTLKTGLQDIHRLIFRPDDRALVAIGSTQVQLWSADGRRLDVLVREEGGIGSEIVLSPDRHTVASFGEARFGVRLWRLGDRAPHVLMGNEKDVGSVRFSPDGRRRLLFHHLLWNSDGRLLQKLSESGSYGTGEVSTFLSDGSLAIAKKAPGTVEQFDPDGRLVRSFAIPENPDWLKFSPDGQILLVGRRERGVELWEVATGNLQGTLDMNLRNASLIREMAFGTDGQTLAAFDSDAVLLWNLDTQELLQTFSSPGVRDVEFSTDGSVIAAIEDFGTALRLRDLTGQLLYESVTADQNSTFTAIAFTPDGRTLAAASSDGKVALQSRAGQPRRVLDLGAGAASLRFSPDGQILATSRDNEIKLWSLDGILLHTLRGHTERVIDVRFAPDGQAIASSGADDTVRLWNLDLEALLAESCRWLSDYLEHGANPSDRQPEELCPATD